MSITECHNLDDIMTSQSIVILNMSKNHAFLVVPTRRDYVKILTCCAIILHLEDSGSHETEAEAKRGQTLGGRPVGQGARPLQESNQDSCHTHILRTK